MLSTCSTVRITYSVDRSAIAGKVEFWTSANIFDNILVSSWLSALTFWSHNLKSSSLFSNAPEVGEMLKKAVCKVSCSQSFSVDNARMKSAHGQPANRKPTITRRNFSTLLLPWPLISDIENFYAVPTCVPSFVTIQPFQWLQKHSVTSNRPSC